MESIMQALQGVFSHKLRSFLTMLGIIIGIASIITIISTIKGTSDQIEKNILGSGNNVVLVELYQGEMAYDMTNYPLPNGVSVLDNDTKKELEKLDGVAKISFFLTRSYETAYFRNTGTTAKVYGVDGDYFSLNGYEIKSGRGFTAKDTELKRNVIILDEALATALFGTLDPVGHVVELRNTPFTVVGIAARSSSFQPVINSEDDYELYAQQSGSMLFMPIASWPLVYQFDEPQNVAMRADSTEQMPTAGKAVAEYLNSHQIAEKAAKENKMNYRNNDQLRQMEKQKELSNATSKQLIWIAGISLLVGGVGVMNIMLVTVTERTGEIGLKKAIGAKRRRILGQFLTEAAVLTGIGGLLGVLAGIGMSELISGIVKTPTSISVPAIFAAALFSVLIGLLFGFFPAVKASKLNPIEALRRE